MAKFYYRKYGSSPTLNFELYETDGVDLRTDAVHATGDTTIMKDELTPANTTLGFTDEGTTYSLVLGATETSCKRAVVAIIDQTNPKAWLDEVLIIETTNHPDAQHPNGVMETGDAQAGAASSITLRAGASSTNDLYDGMICRLVSGTGVGQSKPITAYDGTTKVATIAGTWAVNPASGTEYELIADSVTEVTIPSAQDITDAILDEDITSGHAVTGSTAVHLKDIVADTDSLDSRTPSALSSGGNMKSDLEEVRETAITGSGTAQDPWGP